MPHVDELLPAEVDFRTGVTCPPRMFPVPKLGCGQPERVPYGQETLPVEQIIGHLRQTKILISEGKTIVEAACHLLVLALSRRVASR